MKAATILVVATLVLAGCHADRSADTTPAPAADAVTSKPESSLKDSRDSLLDKNMGIDSQHWASSPTAASSSTTPSGASSSMPDPAEAASAQSSGG